MRYEEVVAKKPEYPTAEQLFHTLDYDGQGLLYYKEFATLGLIVAVYGFDLIEDFVAWMKKDIAEDGEAIIEAFDLNRSGKISLMEFKATCKEKGCEFEERDIHIAFKLLDLSGEDMVSHEEITSMLNFSTNKFVEDIETFCKWCNHTFGFERKAFYHISGGDGSISRNDFEKKCLAAGFKTDSLNYTLFHMFNFIDIDDSGLLSDQEFFRLEGFAIHGARTTRPNFRDWVFEKFDNDLTKAWKEIVKRAGSRPDSNKKSYARGKISLKAAMESAKERMD